MQLGDLTVLDQLKQVRAHIDTLDSRLKAMEERRGQVADQVYVRVRSDYQSQREQLSAEAAPLKVRAREQYGQLQMELAQLDEAFEEHRLAMEEVELRHALGEFDEAGFEQRKQAIAAQLGSRREARDQAMALRERFVDAFGGERELEAMPAAPPPAAQPLHTPPAMPIPPRGPSLGNSTQPIVPITGPAPIPPPVATPSPSAQYGIPPVPATVVAPPVANPTAPIQPVKRANPDGTLVFRPGRLLPLNAEAGNTPTTLSLKPIAIGSDSACDVRLNLPGVGRRQVEIIMSRAGFNLRDVAGGNLVTVNGEPASERILEDGDTIQVGAALFQFKRG